MTNVLYVISDDLNKQLNEKTEKMSKFKQVAIKAKKELENVKQQVIC